MDKATELWMYTEFSPLYGKETAAKIINQMKQIERMTYESRNRKEPTGKNEF